MPTQYQIEQAAGITDKEIAEYIMAQETTAARNAYALLHMQVVYYEPAGFGLLKEAVDDCKKEILGI